MQRGRPQGERMRSGAACRVSPSSIPPGAAPRWTVAASSKAPCREGTMRLGDERPGHPLTEQLQGEPPRWCPWQESNLHLPLRRGPFYPLNYRDGARDFNACGPPPRRLRARRSEASRRPAHLGAAHAPSGWACSRRARMSACNDCAHARRSRACESCGSPKRTMASSGGARSVRQSELSSVSSST